jgi:restriction system protein
MDERYRVLKNSSEVSELKGLAFEEYLAQLFHDLGYKTTKTTASGDFGADVLLHDGDRKIVVQAKQYTSSVGFEAVKEAYFALGYYAADEAWVVTTSSFTHQAINAAEKTGVKLISGSELDVLIARARNTASDSSPNKQATERNGTLQ